MIVEMKVDIKEFDVSSQTLVFIDSIDFHNVHWDEYQELELLWMARNVIKWDGNWGKFLEYATYSNNIKNMTVGSGFDDLFCDPDRWFYTMVSKMQSNRLKIPAKYNNRVKLLYSWDVWLNIKDAYYDNHSIDCILDPRPRWKKIKDYELSV